MVSSVFGTALFVQGPEGLLAERAVNAQVARARREDADVEVSHLDAATLNAGTFTEVTGGSLFSAAQVVIVDDISQLDQSMFDLMAATAMDPPETLVLILVHPGGVKGKGLVDKLKKGKVPTADASAIKPWKLGDFVAAEAKRVKVGMDAAAVAALVEAVGQDARALAGAVEQLADDVTTGAIVAEDVQRYFAGRAEVSGFAVADDVMAGRTADALLKLRWALETGVAPVLLTSAIANALRSVGKYHDLRSTRMPEPELARQIGVPPFKVKQLAQQARVWEPRAIATGVKAAAVADAAVKGAAHDAAFALERLVTELDQARAAAR